MSALPVFMSLHLYILEKIKEIIEDHALGHRVLLGTVSFLDRYIYSQAEAAASLLERSDKKVSYQDANLG